VHAFVLQDWVLLQGGAAQITQPEPGWLDLEAYQDVTFWLMATSVSGTCSISYQTSPTAEDALFTNLAAAVTLEAIS
jgi:hypothetical protein